MFINPKRIPSTGNLILDATHARLAQLINLAYDKWQEGAKKEVLIEALHEFVSSVGQHFAEEIILIREAGYGNWQAHELIHGEFQWTLMHLLEELESGEAKFSQDTFDLLDRLLYEHEFLDDQDFWEIFQKQKHELQRGEPLIDWTDEFSVQHDDIDRQHMALVKLLNRLHLSVERKADKTEILTQLDEIMKHTKWHFKFEEDLILKFGLKGGESHKMLHENLLMDLTGVMSDFEGDKYDLLEDLLENYLKYWLLDHIVHVDRGLGRLLAKAESK